MAEAGGSSETRSLEATDEPKANDDISAIIKEGFAALMPTIRASNSLPKGPQWDLFCTSPSFRPVMDSLGNKALELMAQILYQQNIYRDIKKRDIEEKYELIVEANDKILERVGIHMDELSGIRRNPTDKPDLLVSPVNSASGSWNKNVSQSAAWKEVKTRKYVEVPVLLNSARITSRPQLKFHDKIDNRSIPFEPRLTEKPNSLKPLAILYEELPDSDACYSHPYEFELERFQKRIDKLNLKKKIPQEPKPIAETPLIWVTKEEELEELLQDLCQQTEFAVDLEHHSYRSFQGFTCLMQISTREKDYIVDTLELRHKLHILNEVFTDPKIVKVFHGADSDVTWLQRDFSLYVVNMFDTYQAALLLSLPRLSLAYLLKAFCKVDANKCFQLYDWRTRPLSKDAIKYAREDTHYLLYIYDMLWNKLLEMSKGGNHLLQGAIFRSADTCKKRYWKSIYKHDSYEGMYRNSKKNFDNRQLYALKELHAWRDRIAREEDESTGYVLPNHMLLLIAETLPKEMQGILACCNPIPPLVRQNLVFLHQIILKAREQPLVVRMSSANAESHVRPMQHNSVNLDGALHCPHDLTHNMDFRDNLPTLLDENQNSIGCCTDLVERVSSTSVFDETCEAESNKLRKMSLPNQIHFTSPFQRYKRMLLYLEEEEKKTKEEKEEDIQRDTQNLLDECMRERLKAVEAEAKERLSSESSNIKQEIETENPRKRPRSQDSNLENSLDSTFNNSIKSETDDLDNAPNYSTKKKKYMGENVEETVTGLSPLANFIKYEEEDRSSPSHKKNKRKKNSQSINSQDSEIKSEQSKEENCGSPAKKKKLENYEDNSELTTKATGAKKKQLSEKQGFGKRSSENFTPYDYSQVDYNQYQHSGNTKTNRNSIDKFRHKGKKKQHNKMFTFQREYGSGSGQKK